MCLSKPFLLSFMSLVWFYSRWAFAFITPSLHTWRVFLYSSCVTCPWFYFLYISFYVCVLSGSPCSCIQTSSCVCFISCKREWMILEHEGADSWNSTRSPGPPSWSISRGILPSRFLNLLSWSPGLWSCFLPCSFLSESWSPPSMTTATKDVPSCYIPNKLFFVSMRSSRQSSFVGSLIACVNKFSTMYSRNLLNHLCPAVLTL